MTATKADVVLVGAGAMSATLGMLLKQLDPNLNILMIEKGSAVALESTDGWNNAGTGHAAYCELNYTPVMADGSIDTTKALNINSAFEVSLQFWSYLVESGALPDAKAFINRAPHKSFVWGDDNVAFLRKRYETLKAQPLFAEMEYSEDPAVLSQWMPLVMEGRDTHQKVAGTRVTHGSDVDFGALTRLLVKHLEAQDGFELKLNTEVTDLNQKADGSWAITLKSAAQGYQSVDCNFVFLGAGGGALPLLQKSAVSEGHGYGGFPVSGQWLVCRKPEVVAKHHAKVYGKAPLGAPPMSVPHLDTRIINGEKALLFGPFAGFTTKFLKAGSFLDLLKSVRLNNLWPMLRAGLANMDLTRYLISEVLQSHKSRVAALRKFYPEARDEDWELAIAGQRVQIIKRDPKTGGKLEFGTEVIATQDGSLAALLGASPGASTAAQTMINIIERCFADRLAEPAWREKLTTMVPSYGQSLIDDAELLKQVRSRTLKTLQLNGD